MPGIGASPPFMLRLQGPAARGKQQERAVLLAGAIAAKRATTDQGMPPPEAPPAPVPPVPAALPSMPAGGLQIPPSLPPGLPTTTPPPSQTSDAQGLATGGVVQNRTQGPVSTSIYGERAEPGLVPATALFPMVVELLKQYQAPAFAQGGMLDESAQYPLVSGGPFSSDQTGGTAGTPPPPDIDAGGQGSPSSESGPVAVPGGFAAWLEGEAIRSSVAFFVQLASLYAQHDEMERMAVLPELYEMLLAYLAIAPADRASLPRELASSVPASGEDAEPPEGGGLLSGPPPKVLGG